MTENSTAGLTMLDAERAVVVTGDGHLQHVLRDHPTPVTIELVPVGPRWRRGSTVSGSASSRP